MKLLTTLGKNLKLLFRNKESAYTVVFGPLLIILLVSFAFMGASNDYTVKVGTYSPTNSEFSQRTINILNQKNYLVSVYPTQNDCVDSVKTGTTHACLVFSDKEAGNSTVPVTFYLDMSRTNIIYQIADDLSGALDLQAGAIRQQLAGDALTRMSTASILVERSLNKTEKMSVRFDQIAASLQAAKGNLTLLSNSTGNVSTLQGLKGYQLGLADNTRTVVNMSKGELDKASQMLSYLDQQCLDCGEATHNQVQTLKREIDSTETQVTLIAQDNTAQKLFQANLMLDDAISDLTALQGSVVNETRAQQTVSVSIIKASADADANARDMAQVVTSLRYTRDFLRGESVNATALSVPVATSIVSVTVTQDRLSFTYPYLLVLVIMFIGMLLASMLVVTDKTSRASFRNFTTPTPDSYHIMVAFITAFILLVLEVAIILFASTFFVAQPLFLNLASTIAIIGIAIILFTFIGMIIGYLSSTQEAAMIASISLGSVFLFISNLIIPVEGMTAAVQWVTQFNPYLVLSELLKKSMLYGITMQQLASDLLGLGIFVIILLIITVTIRRRVKRQYFMQEGTAHTAAPLQLGAVQVHSEVELLDALDHMTRAEFEALVTADDNLIANWVQKELRSKRLARQLRTTSKERMILRLDKYLKKHGKGLKR